MFAQFALIEPFSPLALSKHARFPVQIKFAKKKYVFGISEESRIICCCLPVRAREKEILSFKTMLLG